MLTINNNFQFFAFKDGTLFLLNWSLFSHIFQLLNVTGKRKKNCLISGRNFESGNNKDLFAKTCVVHSWRRGAENPNTSYYQETCILLFKFLFLNTDFRIVRLL